MEHVRRGLRSVACGWLAMQLVAFAAAPMIGLCCAGAPASSAHPRACCPGIAPGQMCPMHHSREGGRTCTMGSACHTGDAALLSIFAVVGLVSPATPADRLASSAERLPSFATAPIFRTELPESPPPRA